MEKQSIYQKLYKQLIVLFILFIITMLSVNSFLYYYIFLESKKEIQNNVINTKKEILKNEVDFVVSDIESTINIGHTKVKENIKANVLTAYNIANNLYQKNKHNSNIQAFIKESLRELKFAELGDQYVFMTKLDGTFILVPGLPHLEGKNVFDLQTKSNKQSVKNLIEMVRENKEGYYSYPWQNHHTKEFEEKTSFVKYFEPFDCFIGIGVFNKDIENNLKEKFIEKIESFRVGPNMSNYIFAATYEGISLTYPAKGKNVYEITDINGKKIVQELIKTAQQGSGYVRYFLPFGKDVAQEKISYVVGIDKWNLYVGVGETLTEIDQEIALKKEELFNSFYNNILLTIILTVCALIVYLTILRGLRSTLSKDIENIIRSIENLVNKNKKIDTKDIKFKEFEKIALQTNTLLEQKKVISEELQNKEGILNHQSKMAAMGEMLENIAHQWRQPLSVITTSSSALQLKHEMKMLDDKFLTESIDSILENSDYLSHTIDDFRSFFQKEKMKEKFLLKDAVAKTLKLINSKFKFHNITVIPEYNNIEIETYKNELVQVILVILHNAKDALENLQDEDKLIFIQTTKDENFAYIEITDNAKGISDDIIEKIFEPYFTTKHKSQGTGIGLYMAREIITKHIQGEITVKNSSYTYQEQELNGAEFTIKIPLNNN